MTCAAAIMDALFTMLDYSGWYVVPLIVLPLASGILVVIWYELKYMDALRRERFYASGLRRGMDRKK